MSARSGLARGVLAIAMSLAVEAAVHACPICFQIEDARATIGIRAGVGVMMAVTVVVLGAFARFAIRCARNQ